MGSKKRFFGRGGNRKKRADRVVRPYKVRRKIGGTGGQGRMKPLPTAGMVVLVFCGEIPYNTHIIMAAECGKPESTNMTEGEAWNRYRN